MKTLINTVLKSSLVAIILSASLFNLNASAATVTADKGTSHVDIKRVVVTGNTKVVIVQDSNESVKMDELDLAKVTVKQIGSTLTINSSEFNPVTVVVYVKDIYRIDASGKTSVNTLGKFKVKNLQVLLKDQANARVKANTESLYTVVNDQAKLELLGTSGNHVSKMAVLAKLDTDKFAALKNEEINTFDGITVPASADKTATLSK